MSKTTGSPNFGKPLVCPGMHKVWAHGKLYVYAWRGGPRLETIEAETRAKALAKLGDTDTAARIAAKWTALARPTVSPNTIHGLITDFRKSAAFGGMAQSTQSEWRRHLDEIQTKFGTTTLEAIQKRGARALIKRWHEKMADTPRKADYALTVLTRLFNWAIDEERMERNPAAGIDRLQRGVTRSHITWSKGEIDAMCAAADPHFARIVRFLYLTGMRRGDAIMVTWNDVDRVAGLIRRATSKSNRRHMARIPITPEIAALLDEMPKGKATTIITNQHGLPYKMADSITSAFITLRNDVGIEGKRLHDLRGTRVTLDFAGGMTDVEAEAKYGWAPGQGPKMRAVYADADMVAVALAKAFTA
ncbi:MAG: tyrosine-type recombinase/integrase [Hyphomonas sp.]|uniref:tyrosine-type recombinase/integrase n=1 Tax=Hyphomonas sp. TaxID=87 RepID=UPI0017E4FE2E|nr:tyrosine-type recombinase/integrase [Hyphomonas sp.]MBA3068176.1 tyrosine-type recombinase/integrase [Hyphomonas sp.]MBU3919839.1 hypothetical protein [Alphaproteobacteria bacterium]MBU4062099.1 hypothetical protein [Alphaproteobacteria bacterium]MBU4165533.1 hypothetical protein [Alphaproteobacteria bacterium]